LFSVIIDKNSGESARVFNGHSPRLSYLYLITIFSSYNKAITLILFPFLLNYCHTLPDGFSIDVGIKSNSSTPFLITCKLNLCYKLLRAVDFVDEER
jgi:hypothetical protein